MIDSYKSCKGINMDKELYIKSMAKNYKKDESKIRSVYEVCERYGIEPYGNVFMRTAEDVERIILMLKGISLKPEMIKMAFRQNADSVEKIINICKENLIPVEPTLFYKDDVELKETVEYVKKNFGSRYLKTHILTKDLDTIKQELLLANGFKIFFTNSNDAKYEIFKDFIIMTRKQVSGKTLRENTEELTPLFNCYKVYDHNNRIVNFYK